MGAEGKVINFMVRKETVQERMHNEHPDFQWMRQGFGNYRRSSERPEGRRSPHPGRGRTSGGSRPDRGREGRRGPRKGRDRKR